MKNLYKLFILVIGINSLLLLFNHWTYHHQVESNQISQKSESRILNDNKSDMKQLFCFILTTSKNLEIRAQIVSNTWAKHCDKHVLVTIIKDNLFASIYPNISLEVNEPFPLLQPAGYIEDNYTRLTDKVYATFKHIYSHYNDYDCDNGYEVAIHLFLKADDDTFVFVDNLRKFLKTKNSSDLSSYGFLIRNKDLPFKYHMGGAGYLLGNSVMKLLGKELNKKKSKCTKTGVEDFDVNNCLRNLNVTISTALDKDGRELFHPFSVKRHIALNDSWYVNDYYQGKVVKCCSEDSISFHYVYPETGYMQKYYDAWMQYRKSDSINISSISGFLSSS